jgi:hypothetical protein
MNQEKLCTWLGLAKASWPPDPWTLVGLPRGKHDLSVVEERVQERMQTLRHYQLSYPEEATEGMNRLAEAFVTLAETCGRTALVAPTRAPSSKDETFINNQTKVDWRAEPPPVRKQETTPTAEIIGEEHASGADILIAKPFMAPAKPLHRKVDWKLVRELAEESEEATSNVGTIDAVIERAEATRRLLYAWEKIGKQMKDDAMKGTPKAGEQFARRFDEIAEEMKGYPAFLGHPGKPGYRVVVMARLRIPLPIVLAMTPDQREEMLFDWEVGYQVLRMHRKYLRKLFKMLRHRSTFGLVVHAVRAFLNDYPRATLIGIAVVVVLALLGGVKFALR